MVRFEGFTFDEVTGELREGERVVKLHPQPAKLLALLVERPGELVSRESIRQALWEEDTFVDYDLGINSCVRQLRAALHDDADAPRFVQTLPRKGYRFVAALDVETGTDPAGVEAPSAPRPHPVFALAAVVVLTLGVLAYWMWPGDAPTPPRVISRPDASSPRSRFALSPDGKTLVYSGIPDRKSLRRRVLGAEESESIPGSEGGYSAFFSPDGAWMAFQRDSVLYKVPTAGGPPILVADTVQFGARGATWSKDGTLIVNGAGYGPLYLVPSSGGELDHRARGAPLGKLPIGVVGSGCVRHHPRWAALLGTDRGGAPRPAERPHSHRELGQRARADLRGFDLRGS